MCDFPPDFLTADTYPIIIFFWLIVFFSFLRMYIGDIIIIVTYYLLSFDKRVSK